MPAVLHILSLLVAASDVWAASLNASHGRARAEVTPIQKVVEMLEDMADKGKTEKHKEEVEFARFKEWCRSSQDSNTRSIKQGEAQIEQLSADIAKAETDAEVLAGEVTELEGTVAQAEAELKEATLLRKKEHSDYMAAHLDMSQSIDALQRALVVLKQRGADVPQSLLQVHDSPAIPREAKTVIEAFLSTSSGSELDAPEANAYEFQSGGVVSLLENLRIKFQDQLLSLEKEEMNAKHNFEMLLQKLSDNIKQDNVVASKKTAVKAGRLADAATAKGDLTTVRAGKSEDEKALSSTLATCHARSEEFEKNQVVRSEEVKAVQKAIEVLSSDEVSGAAKKHLPQLVQMRRVATALMQLRGNEEQDEKVLREKLVGLLRSSSQHLGSQYLSFLAQHAATDPFAKVKKMIKDLIVKLMEQANSEADHKAFCDAELATNKQTRDTKQAEVDMLSANIEKNVALGAQLAEELTELSDAVAELRGQQAAAASMRDAEKATNTKTVDDAKAAQSAVEQAMHILKEFYAQAADATLLQGNAELDEDIAQMSKAPYTGMQPEKSGVMGLLEVILSDFARLESVTSSGEDRAAASHRKFMDESSQDIAVKETEIGHKTNKKQGVDSTVVSLKKQLQLTQNELEAALEYYEQLKPDCVDLGLSYSERVQMRKEEIQSLKEALQMLSQGYEA